MRSRTDQRRQAIIDHAAAVFRETGYERASMAQIAARVGGSKTTLYGYFKSKEELFSTVMREAVAAQSDRLDELLDPATDDPRAALLAFGRAYLRLLRLPEVIAVTRIGMAEGGSAALAATLYEQGPCHGWRRIAGHLQSWVDRGLIRGDGDSRIIALHLRGLLEAGVVEPRLYGAKPIIDEETAVTTGVDVFLRAYGL